VQAIPADAHTCTRVQWSTKNESDEGENHAWKERQSTRVTSCTEYHVGLAAMTEPVYRTDVRRGEAHRRPIRCQPVCCNHSQALTANKQLLVSMQWP
jgi:hypothetical protein